MKNFEIQNFMIRVKRNMTLFIPQPPTLTSVVTFCRLYLNIVGTISLVHVQYFTSVRIFKYFEDIKKDQLQSLIRNI